MNASSTHCPSCAAAIRSPRSPTCEYCGIVLPAPTPSAPEPTTALREPVRVQVEFVQAAARRGFAGILLALVVLGVLFTLFFLSVVPTVGNAQQPATVPVQPASNR
jgi:hypothetical protein